MLMVVYLAAGTSPVLNQLAGMHVHFFMYASIAWSFCTSHLKCVLRLPLIFIFSCHIFLHLEEEEEEKKLSKWRHIIKFSSSTKTKHREKKNKITDSNL